jgi:hypothetical protein
MRRDSSSATGLLHGLSPRRSASDDRIKFKLGHGWRTRRATRGICKRRAALPARGRDYACRRSAGLAQPRPRNDGARSATRRAGFSRHFGGRGKNTGRLLQLRALRGDTEILGRPRIRTDRLHRSATWMGCGQSLCYLRQNDSQWINAQSNACRSSDQRWPTKGGPGSCSPSSPGWR